MHSIGTKLRFAPFYYTKILTIIILIILIVFNVFPVNASRDKKFRVVEVHDGDTVSIRKDGFTKIFSEVQQIRLIGIDAPELGQRPWGKLAQRHLRKLISLSDWIIYIEFEFDVKQRDKHGRLLAYLWSKDGKMINESMIRNGYAVLVIFPPNVKYAKEFKSAAAMAHQQKIGIWGENGLRKSPRQWRRENPR